MLCSTTKKKDEIAIKAKRKMLQKNAQGNVKGEFEWEFLGQIFRSKSQLPVFWVCVCVCVAVVAVCACEKRNRVN